MEIISWNAIALIVENYPGGVKCSVDISADTKEELLGAVIDHGVKVHGYEDTPEFREYIVKEFKKGGSCSYMCEFKFVSLY